LHEKTWVFEGILSSAFALVLTYCLVNPGAYPSIYGGELGWSAVVVILVLVIQSFWKTWSLPRELENAKAIVRHRFIVNKWGGLHVSLSIVAFTLVLVHGVVFSLSLSEPSLVIWVGAAAFIALMILNFSGVITESSRPSGAFGRLKRLHLLLMILVIVLAVVHVEGLMTALFSRSIPAGVTVGLLGVLVVFVTVPLTIRTSQ